MPACEFVNVQFKKPPSFIVTTACAEAIVVTAEAAPLPVHVISASVQPDVAPSVIVIELAAPNDEIPELTIEAPPVPATLSTKLKVVPPKILELAVNGNDVKATPEPSATLTTLVTCKTPA